MQPAFVIISSGNKRGQVCMYDIRAKDARPMALGSNDQVGREVCGLALLPGSACLATGSDDGTVKIWDLRMTHQSFKSFTAHKACVKVSFTVIIITLTNKSNRRTTAKRIKLRRCTYLVHIKVLISSICL